MSRAFRAYRRERQEWWVVFSRSKAGSFWTPFTGGEMAHCWAFRGHWVEGSPGLMHTRWTLKVEASRCLLDLDYWFADPDEVAAAFLEDDSVVDIMAVTVDVDAAKAYVPRGLMTCVSVVKAALQVGEWWVLTPRQLREYLLQHGGRSLREEG
jgi:hypothetical protein